MQITPHHCLRKQVATWFEKGFALWAKHEDLDASQVAYNIEWTKTLAHGHMAINAAMLCAKAFGRPPRKCAEGIVSMLDTVDWIADVALAGPGFINVTLAESAQHAWVLQSLSQGFSKMFVEDQAPRVHLEYVSANPTGPLHVGHGRSAAYGSSLAAVLRRAGADVHEAYYLNDAGRQIRLLGLSMVLRASAALQHEVVFPAGCYQGDYIIDIAKDFLQEHTDVLGPLLAHEQVHAFLSGDQSDQDAEKRLAWLEAHFATLATKASTFTYSAICEDIKDDLAHFRVRQHWFSEASLLNDDLPQKVLQQLLQSGHAYEQEGALWFRSTTFGDEKDRVLRRSDGRLTYFAMDAAYHWHKFQQGFDAIIDVFGADHHGYVARIKGVMQALGESVENFSCPLVQFAILYRDGERLSMSTRSGEFVTLRDLQEEVGVDAARFFYLQRKMDQHVDFDLSLAKSQSQDNPVYYLQYAHARIQSVLGQDLARNTALPATADALGHLTSNEAKEVLRQLIRYPDVIRQCALQKEVHGLCHYLRDVAAALHSFYNNEPCLVDDEVIRSARLTLLQAVALVLVDGAGLLGLQLPDRM